MKFKKSHQHLSYLYFALTICGVLITALANSPAPAQAALTPPDPSYDGVLEKADCSQISGWALDQNAPDESINVDIYDGPTLIGIVPANRFRRDMFDGGMANPYHGFLFSTPTSVKNGKIHSIYVNFAGTGIGLFDSPKFIACSASLFPTAVPVTTASGQGSTWEQGVEFSSSMNGIITKVKFWRAEGEPEGGHTARIWNASGTLLTSAPFNEPPTPPGQTPLAGWQYATVNFPIAAGVRYRVSYNIRSVVAKTFNVFSNGPITKGPLTAWSSWYSTPAGTFPTSNSTSNLFADIVFNSPR